MVKTSQMKYAFLSDQMRINVQKHIIWLLMFQKQENIPFTGENCGVMQISG